SEIELTLCVRNAIGAKHVALSEWNRAADRISFLPTSGLVAGHAVDEDLINEHFLAFIGDRVDKPYLFFIVLLRQLNDREVDARIPVTLARVKRRHAVRIGARK